MMNYEVRLANAASETDRLKILHAFRTKYGWHEHHPHHCCLEIGGHPCTDDDIKQGQTVVPLMSAAEYHFVLAKSEREKEEYKKRIFL